MTTSELAAAQHGARILEPNGVRPRPWGGSHGWEFSWASPEDHESIAMIRRALERGTNWVETPTPGPPTISNFGPNQRGQAVAESSRFVEPGAECNTRPDTPSKAKVDVT